MSTLTNRTIRSTYGQLVQLEEKLFQNGFGTGSLSGSYELTGSQFISGTLHITGNLEVTGTASIGYLETIYETASVIYSSGSTKFGDDTSDTHEFTGSVTISGSAYSENWSGSFSGSFFGLVDSASNAERAVTASQADSATTASHALASSNLNITPEESSAAGHYILFAQSNIGEAQVKTDSGLTYVPQTDTLSATKFIGQLEGSASYAETASLVLGSIESASFSETASLAISTSVINVTSTSFAESGDGPFTGSFSASLYSFFSGSLTGSVLGELIGTASIANFATTASHALNVPDTASHALTAVTASYAITASHVTSASFANDATTSSFASTGDGEFSGSMSGSFTGDGSGLTGVAGYNVANSANNRVVTSIDSTSGNAEANLTFDGSTLTIVGNLNTGQGATEIHLMNQNLRTSDNVTFNDISVNSLTETSALKYKENIETLDSGDIIHSLRPVTFDWKESGKRDYGLIAEEVNEHLPELVKKSKEGEVEGIKYTKLTSLLIKVVQDQQKQIEDLKREIRYIENRL